MNSHRFGFFSPPLPTHYIPIKSACILTQLSSSSSSSLYFGEETATALPLSVVLQRLRLDAVAALRLLRLAAQDLLAVADGLLLQQDGLLGVGQHAVRDGFFLQGRRGRRPGHTCTRPRRQGAANQGHAPLYGHAPSVQSGEPAGEQRGDLREENNEEEENK